ncbi:hypothetical protein SPI_08067 [Niveomyces insectorum RCEF 264]|uniref:Uncharacterized protein n=1 Tax=Niveomyces insectorum RCEF 264 TaxID=1081102 RepID=A0A162MGT9_9HYPO|nr:hypothetical protein SPI_08067 [Niveomyces insectorum RCEF 264]
MDKTTMNCARPDSSAAPETAVLTKKPMGLASGFVLHGSQATYVDSSHWSSILEDIRGIREQLSSSAIQAESGSEVDMSAPSTDMTLGREASTGFDLTFGSVRTLDLDQILEALPRRQICDSLVSQYFQSRFTILRASYDGQPENEACPAR